MKKVLIILIVSLIFCAIGCTGSTSSYDGQITQKEPEYANAEKAYFYCDGVRINNQIDIQEFLTKYISIEPYDGYLLPQNIKYYSSNPSIVQVDNNGILTASGVGFCKITATDNKDFFKEITATVNPYVIINTSTPLTVRSWDSIDGYVTAVITQINYDRNGVYVTGKVTNITGSYINASTGYYVGVRYSTDYSYGTAFLNNKWYKVNESFYNVKVCDITSPTSLTLSSPY